MTTTLGSRRTSSAQRGEQSEERFDFRLKCEGPNVNIDKQCVRFVYKNSSPGVFTRPWTKAMVHFDCNTFAANITLAGESSQITPKGVPLFETPPE